MIQRYATFADGDTISMVPHENGAWMFVNDHQAELAKEKDKWAELVGSFTASQHQYLRDMEQLKKENAQLQDSLDFVLQARDFILHEFNRLVVQYGEQKHEIRRLQADLAKKDEEIARLTKDRDEWQSAAKLNNGTYERQQQTIAQLQADLDQVVGEAVWAMKFVASVTFKCGHSVRANNFLGSPLVQAWRAKQKEQP